MRVTVIKKFSYSTTGMDSIPVKPGDNVDIPDHLVAGLAKEKYISVPRATRAVAGAPETQAFKFAPEAKTDAPKAE